MDTPERIASILGRWRERVDAGERVRAEDLLAEHPDLVEPLKEHLSALGLLEVAARAGAASAPRLRAVAADRYRAFHRVGEGGMGIVYWALDTDLNRHVAFKVVKPELGGGGPAPSAPLALAPPAKDTPASQAFETLKARFLHEAWVTGGMEHPGVVPVYEVGETPEGVPYYTMRFVRGERTLAQALRDVTGRGVEERLAALLEPFLKVCDTLRYAHARGVVHRDLKPENVALGTFGEVVVLDWGLAKVQDESLAEDDPWAARLEEYREATHLQTLPSALGTPGYMAPEAAIGRVEEVDERSDVYSLGVMLHEVLVGRMPYAFETYGQLLQHLLHGDPDALLRDDPGLPGDLADLCRRCLARDPAARPPSVEALAGSVRAWQVRSAAARETERLQRDLATSMAALEGLTGATLLRQADRCAAACARVLEKAPGDATALAAEQRLVELRAQAGREEARGARRRLLARLGVAALLVAAGTAWIVADRLHRRRLEAEQAREQEATQRARADAKTAEAESALKRARALGLAAAAGQALGDDARVARLLAIEALRSLPSPETRSAALAVLGAPAPTAVVRAPSGVSLAAALAPGSDRLLVWADTEWRTSQEAHVLELDGTRGATLPDVHRSPKAGPPGTAETGGFTADGTQAWFGGAIGGPDDDGRAYSLWSLADGRLLAEFYAQAVAPEPGGSRWLVRNTEGDLRLLDAAGRETARLGGTAGWAQHALWSPTGTYVLAWGPTRARLIARDGWEGRELAPAPTGLRAAAILDDDRVVLGTDDGRVSVYDTTWKPLGAGRVGVAAVEQFARVGDAVAVQSEDGAVVLLDPETGEARPLRGVQRSTPAAEVLLTGDLVGSPRGDRLLTGVGSRAGPTLWDAQGHVLAAFPTAEGHAERSGAAFSPDGRWVAVTEGDGAVLHDDRGRPVRRYRGVGALCGRVQFTPDGRWLVTCHGLPEGVVATWRVEPEALPVLALPGARRDPSVEPALATDGRVGCSVPTVEAKGGVLRHSVEEADASLPSTPTHATCLALAPDGLRLAVGDMSGYVMVTSPTSERLHVNYDDEGRQGHVKLLAWAGDGTGLFWAATAAPGLRRWRGPGAAPEVLEPAVPIEALLPLAGGGVAALSSQGAVLVWDAQGRVRWRLPDDTVLGGESTTLRATADGGLLVVSHAGAVHVGPDGTRRGRLSAAELPLVEARFHDAVLDRDRPRVLVGWGMGRLALYDLDGHLVADLSTAGDAFFARAAPDGGRFAVAQGAQGAISLWSADGTVLAVLPPSPATLAEFRFDAGGERLHVRTEDDRITTYPVSDARLTAALGSGSARTLTASERRRYADLLGLRIATPDEQERAQTAARAALAAGRLEDAQAGLEALRADLDPHTRAGIEVRYHLACVHAARAEALRRADPEGPAWRDEVLRAGDAFWDAVAQGAFDIARNLPPEMEGPGHDPRLDVLRFDPRYAAHYAEGR